MKNVKEFSKEIKKDLKETNRNPTETITIRVTSEKDLPDVAGFYYAPAGQGL